MCADYILRRGQSQADEVRRYFSGDRFGAIMLITFVFSSPAFLLSSGVYILGINIFAVRISRSLLEDLINYAEVGDIIYAIFWWRECRRPELTRKAYAYKEAPG